MATSKARRARRAAARRTKILAYDTKCRTWDIVHPGTVGAWHWCEDTGEEVFSRSNFYEILPDGGALIERVREEEDESEVETLPAGGWVLVEPSNFGSRNGSRFIGPGEPPAAPDFLTSEEGLRKYLSENGLLPVRVFPVYSRFGASTPDPENKMGPNKKTGRLYVGFGGKIVVGCEADGGGAWSGPGTSYGDDHVAWNNLATILAFWGVAKVTSL